MKLKMTLGVVLAVAVAGGLAGALVGLALGGDGSEKATSSAAAPVPAVPAASSESRGAPTQSRGAPTPEQIYRADAPGVVVITATQSQTVQLDPFTPPLKERVGVLGSGFVIDGRGDVVTNDHVVEGATGVSVGFSSGSTYPATVVGADPSADIAIVRVQAPKSALHPLTLADSAAVQVGDPAYAIGNPFGLDRTMTAGIVSATGRDIRAPSGLTIPAAIQTDAPINHGNSGGPLLDRFGRVIGVNDQIQSGGTDGNVGIGFAVPSDTAKVVAAQLIATGHAQHAWLGVQVETIDPSIARAVRGLPLHGVVVAQVLSGSPAQHAGLRAADRQVTVNGVGALVGGDAITALDGRPIATAQQLASAVAVRRPGDQVRLTVVRGGTRRTTTVTLGNAPSGP